MFLIQVHFAAQQDHNITENVQHQKKQRKQFASDCERGHKFRDVKMLRAHATSAHWQRQPAASGDTKASGEATAINWKRRGSAARLTATGAEFHTLNDSSQTTAAVGSTVSTADKYKSNLLAKIPANSTIVGSTGAMSSNLMSKSITEPMSTSIDSKTDVIAAISAAPTALPLIQTASVPTAAPTATPGTRTSVGGATMVKHVYNRTIDAFVLTDHCRGFLRDRALSECKSQTSPSWPPWGVYCVRWRRSGDPNAVENESKFVVNGIGMISRRHGTRSGWYIHIIDCMISAEVVDPPLNIYCYLDDRMYVKVPMTLTVAIRNPTRYAMHLRTCLKNSEHFMFSGNTQVSDNLFEFEFTDHLRFRLPPLAQCVDICALHVRAVLQSVPA